MSDRYLKEYKSKLRTADEAVKIVKSGDWVEYGEFVMQAKDCDAALARRVNELTDVKVRSVCTTMIPEIVKVDPQREHFIFHDWHFSGISRALQANDACNYISLTYHEGPELIRRHVDIDVAFFLVGPMDANGYFNLGTSNSITSFVVEKGRSILLL